MHTISNTIDRKFTESLSVTDWEIDTDSGFRDITDFHLTVPYRVWLLALENGSFIECADTHIVFDENMAEVFVKDLTPNESFVMTIDGPSRVIECHETDETAEMFDVTVAGVDHRFYGNDILSHNTSTYCAYVLHYILFNEHKKIAILANKGETAREILGRIQFAYEHLPRWMQHGIKEFNKGTFELENGCVVMAAATSSASIRGFSFNCVILDEAAFIKDFDTFYASTYPVISSGHTTKLFMVSTPNGLNHFYTFWKNANKPSLTDPNKTKNGFVPFTADWRAVPGRDEAWRQKTIDETSAEQFAQEFEVEFLGSSGSLISSWKLKQLTNDDPVEIHADFNIHVYDHPVPENRYVMIVDVSRGYGIDNSAFSIIDLCQTPFKQVATLKNGSLYPHELAELLFVWGMKYNKAYILIENNDIGGQVIDHMNRDYEYENLIYSVKGGRAGSALSFDGETTTPSQTTTKRTKRIGCSTLKNIIEGNQLNIVDEATITELCNFVKVKDSYQADDGFHDDLVMTLVLFGYLVDQPIFKELTDDKFQKKIGGVGCERIG